MDTVSVNMNVSLLRAITIFNFIALINCKEKCVQAIKAEDKIVNGRDLGYVKYPWFGVLVLANNDRMVCGCSVITMHHVITAAHCYKPFFESVANGKNTFESIYKVKLGVNDICKKQPIPQIYNVSKVYIHEDYFSSLRYYDIAILQTSEEIYPFMPICLPPQRYNSDTRPKEGTIVGLGKEAATAWRLPCTVKEASVKTYSTDVCKHMLESMRSDADLFHGAFCAGDLNGGTDTCQGDSGGPLQVNVTRNKYILLGLTSFGYGCAKKDVLGIYTDVSHYLEWIYGKITAPLIGKSDIKDTTTDELSTKSTVVPESNSMKANNHQANRRNRNGRRRYRQQSWIWAIADM